MNTVKLLKKFTPLTCFRLNNYNYYAALKMDVQVYKKFNRFQGYGLFLTFAALWPLSNKKEITTHNDQKITMLNDADSLFKSGNYKKSYDLLLSFQDKEDVEIIWRVVRSLYNMAKEPDLNDENKKKLIFEAYEIIHNYLNIYNNHFAVHKWYALLLDAKSGYEGTKERIQQLENVKNHMKIAVTLNPQDATTLYMLGEWCYQVTDMPWYQRQIAKTLFAAPPESTYEEALDYFLKAEMAEPRFYCLNLLMIGKCYLKLNKQDLAKYYLNLAAGYPVTCNDDHQASKQAAELLKKMK